MNLNKVFLLGNLTRDPELRQTPTGQAVSSFGIATNRFFTDKSGQKQKQAEFHNIVAWGKQAETVDRFLRKGSPVLIEGRLQTRSWTDPQGAKRWKTEIVAERIQLGPRNQNTQGPNNQEGESRDVNEPTPVIDLMNENEDEIDAKDIPF